MSALEALHRRSVHFVLCHSDKHPISKGWQKTRPSFAAVEAHAGRGGLIGVIPGSLGCVVVDVDEGGAAAVEALRVLLGDPIATIGTRSGGFHLWYRAPAGEHGNRKWVLDAPPCGGDIRGSNGFVVLWDPVAVVDGLAANFAAARSPSLRVLPKPTTNGRGVAAVRAAPVGARNDTLNRVAFLAAKHGELDEVELTGAALEAGLTAREVAVTLKSAAQAGRAAGGPKPGEIEVAAALAAAGIGDRHAHTPGLGWFLRDGLWRRDEGSNAIRELVHEVLLGNRTTVSLQQGTTTLKVVRELEPLVCIPLGEWDSDPETCGTADGRVLDLRTGQIRDAAGERITMRLGATPKSGEAPLWKGALDRAFTEGEQEWLQTWAGYCLTAYVHEKRFVFVSGTSNSGKSAIFGTLAAAAGGYAATAPDDALFGNVSDHPAWLALLRGRRLLWIDEAPTVPWRTSRVKAITGGQPVQARFMRQDPIEFTPTVKLIAAANGLPPIPAADSGFASRLVQIPLQSVIPENERVPGFERQLRQELPVILNWPVVGANRYLQHGLPAPPQPWTAAGEDYIQGEDTVALWAGQCLDVPDPEGWLPRGAALASWNTWNNSNDKRATRLISWIADKINTDPSWQEVRDTTRSGVRGWAGISLPSPDGAQEAH
ncbi:MAG: phage/plasmid primase, P4 family [Actinomycetia bacterium]|nr:phage/plasmid primase, P4 family [Actinomycetes bacterium]